MKFAALKSFIVGALERWIGPSVKAEAAELMDRFEAAVDAKIHELKAELLEAIDKRLSPPKDDAP